MGLSGGPDSMVLTWLLRDLGVDLVAAHLDHQQRAESGEESLQLATWCESQGIPVAQGRADIPTMARDLKLSIEEAGREARYQFLRQVAHSTGATYIVTAHNRDDHLETILFHIARGTGLSGLTGIPAQRDNILRPLLPFSAEEIRAFARDEEIPTLWDPGNDNEQFARVRVRKRLIPEFEAIHPGFRPALLRLAETVAEEDAFMNGWAAAQLEGHEVPLNGVLAFLTRDVEAAFSTPGLASLPAVLRRRALRLLGQFFGVPLDRDALHELSDRIERGERGSLTAVGGDVVFETSETELHVRQLLVDEPFRFPLTLPGETISDVFGWQITAQHGPTDDPIRAPDALSVVVNAASVSGGLFLRSAQPGDRMRPFGQAEERLVMDFMAERKLTSAARRRLPIICDMVGPIWVPGCRLAERARVRPGDGRGLHLRLAPLGSGQ